MVTIREEPAYDILNQSYGEINELLYFAIDSGLLRMEQFFLLRYRVFRQL